MKGQNEKNNCTHCNLSTQHFPSLDFPSTGGESSDKLQGRIWSVCFWRKLRKLPCEVDIYNQPLLRQAGSSVATLPSVGFTGSLSVFTCTVGQEQWASPTHIIQTLLQMPWGSRGVCGPLTILWLETLVSDFQKEKHFKGLESVFVYSQQRGCREWLRIFKRLKWDRQYITHVAAKSALLFDVFRCISSYKHK